MRTFNQLAADAFDMMGSPADTVTQATNIPRDLMHSLALFKNAARRYWTRNAVSANLVSGQQDYQMPANFVRATEVTITVNGIVYPLIERPSEHKWNELNIIPAVTIYIPTQYFIKGFNVISVWPAPSSNTGTLSVSFEPRTPDYSNADVTGTATVTAATTVVTDSATRFTQQMIGMWLTVTDGTDGNWYKIGSYSSTSVIGLENDYIGISGGGRNYLIGACPDTPEEYHMALPYYAAWQYYLKRKDSNTANEFQGLFEGLFNKYEAAYSSKTTGVVFTKQADVAYSVFGVPPSGLSG